MLAKCVYTPSISIAGNRFRVDESLQFTSATPCRFVPVSIFKWTFAVVLNFVAAADRAFARSKR